MGIILRCDGCGSMMEVLDPATARVSIVKGEELLYVGYLCDECVEKLLKGVKELGAKQVKADAVEEENE